MALMVLKEVSEEEHSKIIENSNKALKEYEKTFKDFFKTISELEPHSRIYFINELIAKVINMSGLPPFTISAILDGLKLFFQSNPQLKESYSGEAKKYIG
jgi:hypothetical protein